ncbi:3-oxoadipate CoA-transferase subunit B [Neomoorella glycerini]|uniref:3-oxoadipate CoA-transferase subunit B n=1 Tax=Neomoorella glycerini TaxID=55779 RepID=A0A6I5ZPW7_9FIRM|nr:CoA-transferase [Moorella glycerini]QGP91629.1 3-oxoadipate CoA-transferase subunit B [Moorella glycerini]
MTDVTYCTIDELMAVCLARTIKDHDVVFNGVAVALPFTAIMLAKHTHARNCVFLGGLPAGVDPQPPFLPPTSADAVMLHGAVTILPLHEIFDLAQKGKLDRIFFGGAQIDKYGNLNNTLIGSKEKIKVKLPGGAGASNLSCFAKNFTVWTSRHQVKPADSRKNYTLVEKVDFITTMGHVTPSGTRKEMGLRGGGPDWVITDLGVFDFTASGELRLKTLHPGVTMEELLDNTSFRPVMAEPLGETPLPTREEIELIRRLDPLNVRKREFSASQLERRYPVKN